MAFEHRIAHNKAPGFDRQMATGMVLQLLADQTMHLTFYRDVTDVSAEVFVADVDPKSVPGPVALQPAPNPVDSTYSREDVFSVIIPTSAIAALVGAFAKVPGMQSQLIKQKEALEASAAQGQPAAQ